MIDKNIIITSARKKMYLLDAETIAFYRRNPCIAAEDLLGIKLFDAQKYILESMWNASHVAACCSRNFGKSFLCGAVFLILKAILYEDQSIYIISSVGDQAKETFTKAEEVVLRSGKTSSSIRSLKDIVAKEVVTSPTNKTGFNHGNSGYRVKFYNGSMISTLNSDPNNARSRRASVVFFDEAALRSLPGRQFAGHAFLLKCVIGPLPVRTRWPPGGEGRRKPAGARSAGSTPPGCSGCSGPSRGPYPPADPPPPACGREAQRTHSGAGRSGSPYWCCRSAPPPGPP